MNVRELHVEVRRRARIYEMGDEGSSEVWIVCHGYGQLASKFIREFEHIAKSRRIIAPEGLHRFYLDPPPAPAAARRVGATWMTREDRETDIADYVRYLDVVAGAHPDAGRLRALGFSQGVATIFRWAVYGAAKIDELILWAGEVPRDVDVQKAADRLAETRIVLVFGTRDELLPREARSASLELLDLAGLSYEVRAYNGAHHLDATLLAAIASGNIP